jgi:hypothetical protein
LQELTNELHSTSLNFFYGTSPEHLQFIQDLGDEFGHKALSPSQEKSLLSVQLSDIKDFTTVKSILQARSPIQALNQTFENYRENLFEQRHVSKDQLNLTLDKYPRKETLYNLLVNGYDPV